MERRESAVNVVPVIVGPTASGKTGLSIELARRHPTIEIVSADSRQLYIGMDIGTAKVSPAERRRVPHHLIDIVPPTEGFTAGDYAVVARDVLAGISRRGGIPLVVGGSGFYISALVHGLGAPTVDASIYHELVVQAEREGFESVYRELLQVDPIAARAHSPNNRAKVFRALACYRQTGKPYSSFAIGTALSASDIAPRYLGIVPPRDRLYRRINERVEEMVDAGLIEEVRELLRSGVPDDAPGFKTVGYAEAVRYLRGELRLEEMTAEIQQATRRYAKRQLTWFRRLHDITWLDEPDVDQGVKWLGEIIAAHLQ